MDKKNTEQQIKQERKKKVLASLWKSLQLVFLNKNGDGLLPCKSPLVQIVKRFKSKMAKEISSVAGMSKIKPRGPVLAQQWVCHKF